MTEDRHMYRKKLYDSYIKTHFGKIHSGAPHDMEMLRRYYKKNYASLLPKDKNARILDVGSGMGHFLYFLDKEGYKHRIGIDISEQNTVSCKERGYDVRVADVFDFLRENKEPFDAIVMNDIIEHFDKNEIMTLFELTHTNLRQSGILIVKTLNASNPILGASNAYVDFTHETLFTEESLFQVLSVCGFDDVRILPQDIYVFYQNPVNYIAKLCAMGLSGYYRLMFRLYGRKNTTLFTKSIIGTGRKS